MRGFAEYFGSTPALNNLSLMHDRHSMADGGYGKQVMRDIEDAHTEFSVEGREQLQDFCLRDQVEGTGRLIGNQQWRAMENGHRDQHSLGLADTELRRISLQKFFFRGQA